MKLRCQRCGSDVPVPEEATQSPEARVTCPGCKTRYRLRPRAPSHPTPATHAPAWTPSSGATGAPAEPPTTPLSHPPAGSTDGPTLPTRPGQPAGKTAVFTPGDLVAERYRVVRFLARGGMGEVYEVEDLELRERVALKTITEAGDGSGPVVERFKREIQLARRVTHPNVCRIFDFGLHRDGDAAGITFLTMELLAGETLSRRLRRLGRLSTEAALPIVSQIAEALSAAHHAGIVHRDLKSENVFLVPHDGRLRVVVTDFGVARGAGEGDRFAAMVTNAGIVGTPAYMAPEQVEGKPVTAAADVYAFGVVLYEAVTGRLPFEGDNPLTTAVKRLKHPPPPPRLHVPDLEARWERVILRCLARQPESRYGSPREAIAALQTDAAEPPPSAPRPQAAAPAPPAPAPAATPRATPRRRLVLELALLALVGAVALVYFLNRPADEAPLSAPRRSVAVLGFKNSTGRPEVAWMSTALAEMVGTEIALAQNLRAIPGEIIARVRRELELEPTEAFSPETLGQLRSLLGCDFVVSGSYVSVAGEGGEQLRLDLRLQDASLGRDRISFAESGTLERLFELVAEVGERLREELGAGSAGDGASGYALPKDPRAARLYSEALDQLRATRPLEARRLLQEAVGIEPEHPLLHAALSTTWGALGHTRRAAEAAERAFELSHALPAEERLLVEGRYRETDQDWQAAVEAYSALWGRFPDNLEYGLRLITAQVSARRPDEALTTLGELRRLPGPGSEDPRGDLAEANIRGLLSDYPAQLEAAGRAAERAEALGADLLVAQALLQQSLAYRFLGGFEEAEATARRASGLYADHDHPTGAALALTSVANSLFARGRTEAAVDSYQEALDGYHHVGDQGGAAAVLNNLALVYKRQGDLARAESLYREAQRIYTETGDRIGLANTLNNLAALQVSRGQLSEAVALFAESQAAWEELGDLNGQAYAISNLAAVRRRQGQLAESRVLNEQALDIRRQTGQRIGEVSSLTNLGAVFHDLGDLDRAAELLEEAVRMADEMGERSRLAQALFYSGELASSRGDLAAARGLHERALALRGEMEERPAITESQIALARLTLLEGKPAAAQVEAQVAALACRRQGRPSEEARARAILVRAFLADGSPQEAGAAVEEALALAQQGEHAGARLEVELAAAGWIAATADPDAALELLVAVEERASRSGFEGVRLEAILAQSETAAAAGRPDVARERLTEVEAEATIRGFGLLIERAAALDLLLARRSTPG